MKMSSKFGAVVPTQFSQLKEIYRLTGDGSKEFSRTESVDLPKENHYRRLIFEIRATTACATAASTLSNFLKTIRIVAGSQNIRYYRSQTLKQINTRDYSQAPQDDSGGTANHTAVLIVDFMESDMDLEHAINASKLSTFTLEYVTNTRATLDSNASPSVVITMIVYAQQILNVQKTIIERPMVEIERMIAFGTATGRQKQELERTGRNNKLLIGIFDGSTAEKSKVGSIEVLGDGVTRYSVINLYGLTGLNTLEHSVSLTSGWYNLNFDRYGFETAIEAMNLSTFDLWVDITSSFSTGANIYTVQRVEIAKKTV